MKKLLTLTILLSISAVITLLSFSKAILYILVSFAGYHSHNESIFNFPEVTIFLISAPITIVLFVIVFFNAIYSFFKKD